MARGIKLGIASKINLAIFAFIFLTTFILSLVLIRYQVNTVTEELKSRGEALVRNLAYNAELGTLAKDKDGLHKLLSGLDREKDVGYCSVSDKEGKIISEVGHRDKTVYIFSSPVKTKTIPASLGMEGAAIFFEENLPEENIGEAYLELSLVNLYNVSQNITFKTLLFSSLSLIIFAIVLIFFVSKIIIRPLSALVEATKRVAQGDLNYKVANQSQDEIGTLALSFNNMTQNLKDTYDKLEKRTNELEIANKELKEAQFQLIQSSKMAAIGQLGAGVAHELNNPLGGVLGYAQFIMQKVKKPDFSHEDFNTCATYLGHIEREALRCKGIVENLLKFSRGPKKEMEDVDLNKVLKETMPLTSHGLRAHKINLIENYDAQLPLINGNFNKLQQVMVNMIINAEQAMPEGGDLKISTFTKRDGSGNPVAVAAEIEDAGCGIAPENLSRIFDPFFTTKQNSKGTGLGLSVSYDIIQEHHGDIKVESQLNKGTKFTITLPIS